VQPPPAAIDVPPDAQRLIVEFANRSFNIEADQAQSIAAFIGDIQVPPSDRTIIVNAYAFSGEGAISEARRLAYYRAMIARKQLVNANVQPGNIQISVHDTADRSKGSTIELIVAGGAH
jgi:hypothetical protein